MGNTLRLSESVKKQNKLRDSFSFYLNYFHTVYHFRFVFAITKACGEKFCLNPTVILEGMI